MGPSPTEVGDFFDAGGNVFLTAHPNDGDFDDQVLALFGASLRKGVVEDSRSNVETLFDHQLNIPVTTQVRPMRRAFALMTRYRCATCSAPPPGLSPKNTDVAWFAASKSFHAMP